MVKTTGSHACLVPSSDLFIQQHHRPIHMNASHLQYLPMRVTGDSSCDTSPAAFLVNSSMCSGSNSNGNTSNLSNNNNNHNNNNNNSKDNNSHQFYSCNSGSNYQATSGSGSNSLLHHHLTPDYSHGQCSVSSVLSGDSTFPDHTSSSVSRVTFPVELNPFGSQTSPNSQALTYPADNRMSKCPPCLPYGLYYDFDDGDSDTDIIDFELNNLKSFTNHDDDEWTMDVSIYDDYNTKRLKSITDTGPTLAELNCSSDATDTDDLFSSPSVATVTSGYSNVYRTTQATSINYMPCNIYESDTKTSKHFTGDEKVTSNLNQCKLIEEEESKLLNAHRINSCDLYVKENVAASSTNKCIDMKVHEICNTTTDRKSSSSVTSSLASKSKESRKSQETFSATVKNNCPLNVNAQSSSSSPSSSSSCHAKVEGRKNSSVTFCEASTSNCRASSSSGEMKIGCSDGTVKLASNQTQATLTSPDLARVRNSSLSTEGSISSHDEGFASQPEDTDDEENDSSDDDSFYGDYDAKDLLGASTSDDFNNKWSLNIGRARKNSQQRYFWQYNVQAKGPKGNKVTTVVTEQSSNDPHVLMEASDPVFSPECAVKGVKHAGKARRGDGNDLTPNPRKLLMIGLELKKLSQTINQLTPVAEVPVSARGKSRKEKNKLASRACRLKKKAQHEANKIKLFGLQQEHRKTLTILDDIKLCIKQFNSQDDNSPVCSVARQLIGKKHSIPKVAGQTAEFVNMILDNVASGQTDGGLTTV